MKIKPKYYELMWENALEKIFFSVGTTYEFAKSSVADSVNDLHILTPVKHERNN